MFNTLVFKEKFQKYCKHCHFYINGRPYVNRPIETLVYGIRIMLHRQLHAIDTRYGRVACKVVHKQRQAICHRCVAEHINNLSCILRFS